MMAGGIAMTRLKAMEAALSRMPTVFTWPIKKFTTSNIGIPLKPGNEVDLLLCTICLTGEEEDILFPIFEKIGIIFLGWPFWQSPFFLLIPAGKVSHILNDR